MILNFHINSWLKKHCKGFYMKICWNMPGMCNVHCKYYRNLHRIFSLSVVRSDYLWVGWWQQLFPGHTVLLLLQKVELNHGTYIRWSAISVVVWSVSCRFLNQEQSQIDILKNKKTFFPSCIRKMFRECTMN